MGRDRLSEQGRRNRDVTGDRGGDSRGDDCAIKLVSCNIRSGRGSGLKAVARGLRQMRADVAVLQKTKVTVGRHTLCTRGYTILATDVPSAQKGGVTLVWEENYPFFEVKVAKILSPNVITFQLVTGRGRFSTAG